MTYAKHAIVKKNMTIFKHESFELNLTNAGKAKLYSNNNIVFIGDGYIAIQILLRNCEDKLPVQTKFHSQLSMREKPRFKDKS